MARSAAECRVGRNEALQLKQGNQKQKWLLSLSPPHPTVTGTIPPEVFQLWCSGHFPMPVPSPAGCFFPTSPCCLPAVPTIQPG